MAIKKSKFIWMDGKFVKWEEAKVHILTHAIHYGSAVFEGIHSYKTEKGTAIFRLDIHIDRLFRSANAISMNVKFTKKQLREAIKKLVKTNKIQDGYIRPIAYYGYGNIGVFPKDVPTNISIIAIPWGHYYSKDLSIMNSRYRRHSEKSAVYGTKISGNYANSILAMYEARKKGYDEALMLDLNDYVSEGPAENIFLVKNGSLIAPESRSALPGITRDSIIKICKDLGIKVYVRKVKLKELKNANELFYCGTATEVAPIISVDGKKIGDGKAGKITLMIKERYIDIVRGNNKKYIKWLTFV
ncbi:branched-chain amino acid transaminase [Candidatus Woesearchaeota archaeon]|nr:branched-chain amino acid transaminase [Candidatus Woesearchaeota archaeon]